MNPYLSHLGSFGLGLALASIAWTFIVSAEINAWKSICNRYEKLIEDFIQTNKQSLSHFVRLSGWAAMLSTRLKEHKIEHPAMSEWIQQLQQAEKKMPDSE